MDIIGIRAILIDHHRRYPLWTIDDLYKLLHQSAMGSEHEVPDEAFAVKRLAQEIARLGNGPEEPLFDPISPGGQVVRVHLRPFIRNELDPTLLLDAFIRTAQEFPGVKSQLDPYGATAARLAQDRLLPFDPDGINRFFTRMNRENFPAIHHSPVYVERYRPAYRVVARQFIPFGLEI